MTFGRSENQYVLYGRRDMDFSSGTFVNVLQVWQYLLPKVAFALPKLLGSATTAFARGPPGLIAFNVISSQPDSSRPTDSVATNRGHCNFSIRCCGCSMTVYFHGVPEFSITIASASTSITGVPPLSARICRDVAGIERQAAPTSSSDKTSFCVIPYLGRGSQLLSHNRCFWI
jgi:hypothetical protein